jgi:1,2-phenylacetyl-CoA epoxidase catalytic subunit
MRPSSDTDSYLSPSVLLCSVSPDDRSTDPDDESLDDLLDRIAAELRATEELPVAASASVWLGEAQAVAEDLAESDLDQGVVHERVGHVRDLLANAGDLDGEVAERVATARRLSADVADRLADTTEGEVQDDG